MAKSSTSNNLPANLVKLATSLASLKARRTQKMRELREINGLIRRNKREMRALAESMAQPDPYDQMPPFRTLGEK